MFKKIGFIGAGAVGKSMGLFMYRKGEPVGGYYSRQREDATLASNSVAGEVFNQLADLVERCDCIALTVNDDAISRVVNEVKRLDIPLKGKFVFHTSGAHSSQLLEPLEEMGAFICSIHPLQAFVLDSFSMSHLQEMYCSVEGMGRERAVKWLEGLGIKSISLSETQKKAYHMAAVMVSNFLVPLIAEGVEIFKTFGLDSSEAFDALNPLIVGTLNNIKNKGVENALTGPFARGDISTIQSHLSVDMDLNLKTFYIEGAKHTLQFIEKYQDLTPAQEEIGAILREVE